MSNNPQQYLKTSKAISYLPENNLPLGCSSGSDPVTNDDLYGAAGLLSNQRISQVLNNTLYPDTTDFYKIDGNSTGRASFEIDLRNPHNKFLDLDASMISAHTDPGDSFAISADGGGNMLIDDGAATIFSTAVAGEKAGFEVDLTSKYPNGAEVYRFDIRFDDNATDGDPWDYDWNVEYSTNGTDFFNARANGTDYNFSTNPDITTTTRVFNLEFNPDFQFGRGGLITEQGKIPKIKKLRFYIDGDDITGGDQVRLYIDFFRLRGIHYDYPDGVYFKQFEAQIGDDTGDLTNPHTFSLQCAYNDIEDFTHIKNVTTNTGAPWTPTIFDNPNYYDDIVNDTRVKKVRLVETTDPQDGIGVYELTNIEINNNLNDKTLVNFDFNDTVLTTKGWNSSRYDGKQLSAARINEFTKGDITYGKSPVVERYTRNIYIGNDVVNTDENNLEDTSLLPFNGFSYVQTNYYITVNEDGSITHNRLKETTGDSSTSITQKVGFYQAFYDDFPTNKGCRLIIYDPTKKNNLKPNYPIYFNQGQLQGLVRYFASTPFQEGGLFQDQMDIRYFKDGDGDAFPNNIITWQARHRGATTVPSGVTADLWAFGVIDNEELVRKFFPKGIDRVIGENGVYLTNADDQVIFYEKAFEYQKNSNYIGDKRFFLSFIPKDSKSPIRTIATGSIPIGSETPLTSADLRELSTVEIISASVSSSTYVLSSDNENRVIVGAKNLRWHIHTEVNNFNQDYIIGTNQPGDGLDTNIGGVPFQFPVYDPVYGDISPTPELVEYGGVAISQTNDSVPSLLIPLNKDVELPQGPGNRPFVIIPENLHPYVEDNLAFYLSKAGINVSEDASELIEEINTNKRRGSRLSPVQRRALARRQALAREQWMNRDSEKERRKEARQNRRKKRKENRQERREDRRENRQNRREDRRENRQNKKENRQEKRQGRKNRRKNRRKNK